MNTDELEQAIYMAERRVLEIQTKLHRWASDDPHRRFDDLCELCEHGATVAVHQVATLSQLGGPGPGQPAWAALMERMRPKTLIVCAPSHEHIHANSIEHAA